MSWFTLAAFGAGLTALDPDPPPGFDLSVSSCEGCHPREAAQWEGSRHAVAGTNSLFWEAWTRWPNGWCVNCHAPLAQGQLDTLGGLAVPGLFPQPQPPSGLWTEGVNCATCHIAEGTILSADEPSAAAEAAHPIRVDPGLRGAASCASCHEFPFQRPTLPGEPFALGKTLAQATVSEWATSRARAEGQTCQSCHMGQEGHLFSGAHDPERLRGLLQVEVEAQPDGEHALFTVSAPGAAHRVPTGDPFRRLIVETCLDALCAEPVDSIVLRRVFATTADGWVEVLDRTIPPERPGQPARREVLLSAAGASHWRLRYALADETHEAALPLADRGYVVHEGPL